MLKVVLVVVVIAFVVWTFVRLIGPRNPNGGKSQPRVIGPDDDPDFLRGLNRPRKPEDD